MALISSFVRVLLALDFDFDYLDYFDPEPEVTLWISERPAKDAWKLSGIFFRPAGDLDLFEMFRCFGVWSDW